MTWLLIIFINAHPVAVPGLPREADCRKLLQEFEAQYGRESTKGRCFQVRTK